MAPTNIENGRVRNVAVQKAGAYVSEDAHVGRQNFSAAASALSSLLFAWRAAKATTKNDDGGGVWMSARVSGEHADDAAAAAGMQLADRERP